MPHISMHSPVGDLTLHEHDGVIVSLDWGWVPDQDPTAVLKEAKRQLETYFDGETITFDLPLEAHGTDFQEKVWREISKIPYGKTMTYGSIARSLSSHARAVGAACGLNPLPILIPCHRVRASDGKLTGYSGEGGLETKAALLRLEKAIPDAPPNAPSDVWDLFGKHTV
jgi:methylated-DNA-[protein]-cysteine S-methyltransferase